jgi:cell division protein FtsZ
MDRRTFVNALALSASTPTLAQALLDNDAPRVSLRTIERRKTDDPNTAHRIVHVIGIGRDGGRLLNHLASKAFEGNITLMQVDRWSTHRTYTSLSGNDEQVRMAATVTGAQIVFLLVNVAEPNTAYVASVVADAARSTEALTVGLAIPTTHAASDSYAAQNGMNLLASAVDTVIALPDYLNMEASPQRAVASIESEVWATVQGLTRMLLKPPFDRLACMNIREVLKERGRIHMGIGYGIGEQRAVIAAAEAIAGLDVAPTHLCHADAVLVIVTGPPDMTPAEAHTATRDIGSCFGAQTALIPGWQYDMHWDGHIRVAVIATEHERRLLAISPHRAKALPELPC